MTDTPTVMGEVWYRTPAGADPGPGGRVRAFVAGVEIGYLTFDSDGFVSSVKVQEQYRRQGVATSMVRYMENVLGITPSFAGPDSGNTADGDAWIAALQSGKGFYDQAIHDARERWIASGEPFTSQEQAAWDGYVVAVKRQRRPAQSGDSKGARR